MSYDFNQTESRLRHTCACLTTHSSHPTPFHHTQLAPAFVASNNLLNLLLLLPSFACLEHGSSNLLWLACTLMVPLSNLAFSLPGIPDRTPATPGNGLALLIITVGLCVYGFSKKTALRVLGRFGLLPVGNCNGHGVVEKEGGAADREGAGGDGDGRALDATAHSSQQPSPVQSAASPATSSSSSSSLLSPAAFEVEGPGEGEWKQEKQEQGWGLGWWLGLVGWGGRRRPGHESLESGVDGGASRV